MTTITVEIDSNKDISALKAYLLESGYKFDVDSQEDIQYSNEFKAMLDERYEDYINGTMPVISASESQKRTKTLLDSFK